MIEKIISGGQTGADRGGLEAAELLGITTGGFAPSGFKTESGCDTSLQTRFGLIESSGGYKERTIENIKASNGTAVFSPNSNSPGTQLTLDFCKKLNKPVILVKCKKDLLKWINDNGIRVLNIAGNRESVALGVQNRTRDFLIASLARNDDVFVFGSNADGKHGKGAALFARTHFGAEYNNPRGIQGRSYAIVTKKDWSRERSSTLEEIGAEISEFINYAGLHPENRFLVTEIGCGLAGFSTDEIGHLFQCETIPDNVVLPKSFNVEKPVKQLYLDLQEKRIDEIQVKQEEVIEPQPVPVENFVHLHCHSDYSLLDGVASVDKMVERVKELGQGAMALTDHGNMFGLYKFQKACLKNGIKPILGVEAYYVDNAEDREQRSNYHIIILVQTEQGWRNLCKIITNANREGYYYKPRTDRKNLEKYGEGLIILSGCYKSPVSYHFSQEGYDPKKAEENLKFFIGNFGDRFYNEVMCIDFPEYDNIVMDFTALADKYGVKTCVTNDIHYLKDGDHKLQSMLLKISTGGKMEGFETQGLFIKSRAEMIRKYITPAMADMTTEIAQRIDFKLNFEGYKFPSFDIESTEDYNEFMKEMKTGFKFLGA